MKEEKLEQLRTVFKKIIEEVVEDAKSGYCGGSHEEQYIKKTIQQLSYEVKIRINNK